MYRCSNCSRIFNRKYDNCLGCGANSLIEEPNINNKIIENHRGIVCKGIIKKRIKDSKSILIFMLLFLILIVKQYEYISEVLLNLDKDVSLTYTKLIINSIFMIIIFIIIITKGISTMIKYEKLKNNSTLIKNIPCEIITKKNSYKIKVKYTNNIGEIKEYLSETKKGNIPENTTTADLLICLDKPKNYYVDFEIY